jgi:hypothetical protein
MTSSGLEPATFRLVEWPEFKKYKTTNILKRFSMSLYGCTFPADVERVCSSYWANACALGANYCRSFGVLLRLSEYIRNVL